MNPRIAIVGAGPAGAQCAIWLKQLGYNPILIEKSEQAGGLQTQNPYTNSWICTSPGATGKSVTEAINKSLVDHRIAPLFQTQVLEAYRDGACFGLKVEGDHDGFLCVDKLVIASGTKPSAGNLIQRASMIVGASPLIESQDIQGQKIAILGGGDSACETYKKLMESGAAEVHVYARTLRARDEQLNYVNPDCLYMGKYSVSDHTVTTEYGHANTYDRIVVMYGFEANLKPYAELGLALNDKGFIHTTANCETTTKGVYAVGEVAGRSHPCVVTSMADGVVCAKAIQAEIESKGATLRTQLAKTMRIGANLLKGAVK